MTSNDSKESRPRWGTRKNLIVSPAFQWKYTAIIVGGVFVVSIIMSSALYGFLYEQARARTVHLATTSQMETLTSIVIASLLFAVVPAGAFGLWSLMLTHRICGPMTVMAGNLRTLAAGRFPKQRELRKRDEFKDFYRLLGRTIEAMKARKEANLDVLLEIASIARDAANGDDQARKKAIAEVSSRVQGLCAEATEMLGTDLDRTEPSALPDDSIGVRDTPHVLTRASG